MTIAQPAKPSPATARARRHKPDARAIILEMRDIPRIRSGNIVEPLAKKVLNAVSVGSSAAVANPEALDEFRRRKEVAK